MSKSARKAEVAPKAAHSPERPRRLPLTVSLPELLDPDGGDATFRQLLYDMAISTNHLDTARSFLARELGVTPPQYNMLMVIAQSAGAKGMSVNEVASRLHVRPTFVTAETKKLVNAGLVEKVPNPTDARSVLLVLTRAAEEHIRALKPQLLLVNDHMFQHLRGQDFRHLARIFASLITDFANTATLLEAMARNSTRNTR